MNRPASVEEARRRRGSADARRGHRRSLQSPPRQWCLRNSRTSVQTVRRCFERCPRHQQHVPATCSADESSEPEFYLYCTRRVEGLIDMIVSDDRRPTEVDSVRNPIGFSTAHHQSLGLQRGKPGKKEFYTCTGTSDGDTRQEARRRVTTSPPSSRQLRRAIAALAGSLHATDAARSTDRNGGPARGRFQAHFRGQGEDVHGGYDGARD